MKARLLRAPVLGACFAAASAVVSAQADTTTISFNVALGACSGPIAVPANNKPVFLTASMIGAGYQGVGGVVLLRANPNNLLDWAGTDYYTGLERSYTSSAGSVIMTIDYSGYVTVQTATSTHIQVCNASGGSLAHAIGYVSFFY